MSPVPYPINGNLHDLLTYDGLPVMSFPSSLTPGVIVAIVFGLCHTGLGLATIWQSQKIIRVMLNGAQRVSVNGIIP